MTVELIDTHCHLDFPVFDGWRDKALSDAKAANVKQIVVPGVVAKDWAGLLGLCREQETALKPVLGLHPCFLYQHREQDLEELERLLACGGAIAVGEIGLDFFIPEPDVEGQLYFFESQLKLAADYKLPVLLHVRKAHDQVLKLLRRYRLPRGGIVHAFSGSEQQAEHYLTLGFKLGLGGSLTYERAKKLRRLAQTLPLASFVLETDAPDIPLSDYRDQPNEPCRVLEVAQVLAELRGISLDQVAEQTTATAKALLDL